MLFLRAEEKKMGSYPQFGQKIKKKMFATPTIILGALDLRKIIVYDSYFRYNTKRQKKEAHAMNYTRSTQTT